MIVLHDYLKLGYKSGIIFNTFWDWFSFMAKDFKLFNELLQNFLITIYIYT